MKGFICVCFLMLLSGCSAPSQTVDVMVVQMVRNEHVGYAKHRYIQTYPLDFVSDTLWVDHGAWVNTHDVLFERKERQSLSIVNEYEFDLALLNEDLEYELSRSWVDEAAVSQIRRDIRRVSFKINNSAVTEVFTSGFDGIASVEDAQLTVISQAKNLIVEINDFMLDEFVVGTCFLVSSWDRVYLGDACVRFVMSQSKGIVLIYFDHEIELHENQRVLMDNGVRYALVDARFVLSRDSGLWIRDEHDVYHEVHGVQINSESYELYEGVYEGQVLYVVSDD